jgi:5'-phosphate synthase pdxT subunit
VIGVLALQGGFEAHRRLLDTLDQSSREVRTPADLEGLDALIIPGGESTTITLGIERERLAEPLRDLVAAGTPVLGTCAGLIVLDRDHLGVMDILARRNAFGRQLHSFEADIEMPAIDGAGAPVRGVFIRAPWIAEHGDAVEIVGEIDGHAIAARQGSLLVVAFHPELAGEARLHRWLIERAAARQAG